MTTEACELMKFSFYKFNKTYKKIAASGSFKVQIY